MVSIDNSGNVCFLPITFVLFNKAINLMFFSLKKTNWGLNFKIDDNAALLTSASFLLAEFSVSKLNMLLSGEV